jgi:hypothetical protein|tara:strand:- start:29 stop:574 length:546 start_codon:yes stop_codon:yes gene_type:complete
MGIPTLIADNSADTTDLASVDFTSGIDSTYDEYMFVFTDINPATDDAEFTFQVNATDGADYNDSAITSTAFFAAHKEDDSDTTFTYTTDFDAAQSTSFIPLAYNIGNGADESLAGVFHLFSPSSTTYVKHFYSRTISLKSNDYPTDYYASGYINDTTAVDDIRFKMDSGNFDGLIQMYGIA